jgi:very-short-patch-repair endonuclease
VNSIRGAVRIQQFAKENRKTLTPTESLFWNMVRDRRLAGYKFYRQRPVATYILDFYCPELKLAVEIDGPIHERDDRRKHDQFRDQVLFEQGIQVIRFTNEQVEKNPDDCLNKIREFAGSR